MTKYIAIIVLAVAAAVGGYLYFAPKPAQNHLVTEEEVARDCNMDVVVYSTPYCRYCKDAKSLFRARNWDFREVDLTKDRKAASRVVKITGQQTVPQIFINNIHIGGFSELKSLHTTGKLDQFGRTCDPDHLK